MKRYLSLLAICGLAFANTAFGAYSLVLTPASGTVLYGDKSTSVKACVTDTSTNAGVPGVTFTGGVYFQGGYWWNIGATVNGKNAKNTVVTISGISTGSTGCATIPVATWGIPPTVRPTNYFDAYVSITASVANVNQLLHFKVDEFKYTTNITSVSTDGTYSIAVQVSDSGGITGKSNDFHGLYVSALCNNSTHASVVFTSQYSPPSRMIDTTNTATFPVTVSNSVYSDPTAPSTIEDCHYSFWLSDTASPAVTTFSSTNTCWIGLSPGDPNCGPLN